MLSGPATVTSWCSIATDNNVRMTCFAIHGFAVRNQILWIVKRNAKFQECLWFGYFFARMSLVQNVTSSWGVFRLNEKEEVSTIRRRKFWLKTEEASRCVSIERKKNDFKQIDTSCTSIINPPRRMLTQRRRDNSYRVSKVNDGAWS